MVKFQQKVETSGKCKENPYSFSSESGADVEDFKLSCHRCVNIVPRSTDACNWGS